MAKNGQKRSGRKRRQQGVVYLLGFGPGDPELLTLKAWKILRKADVVYYDDLTSADFVRSLPSERIYVGKRRGKCGMPQDQINKLLYQSARLGKTVVRLKGGDPFIFGRGGEELEYLKTRSVRVEVIPGVTAASAAAAAARFPLTQRHVSSSVSFCVGHPEGKIRVPDTETIVYYMGAKNLRNIAREMIDKGWPPHTPLALIANATLPGQKIRIGTLQKMMHTKYRFSQPLIIIVGKVVKP